MPCSPAGWLSSAQVSTVPILQMYGRGKAADYLVVMGKGGARGPTNLWIVQSQSRRKYAAVGKGQPLREVSGLGAGGGGGRVGGGDVI